MTENLYELFRGRFPADSSAPFIEAEDGRTWSYRELDQTSGRFARLLTTLGVAKGDRVAVLTDKSPQAILFYLACLRAGAIYLPLNTAYRRPEVEHVLADAEPAVMVCAPKRQAEFGMSARAAGVRHLLTLDAKGGGTLVDSSRDLAPGFESAAVSGDELAALLYTSGTTGRPKGAMLSHGNLAANALTLHRAWGFEAGDVLLHALPIFHTHGLFVAINCVLLNGSAMLLLPRFDAARVIAHLPRATVFMGVPTYYLRLLGHPGLDAACCAGMRLFVSGSAPLLDETFHAFHARTGHTILERYGMTETGMNTSNPLAAERRAGTVGPPLPGVEARVVDAAGGVVARGEAGVLEVRGANVFKGYWRDPEKTRAEFRADGFFVTGDLARIDSDGYVSIVGRARDLIISGGYNVYPKEVEARIDAIDGVEESAVVGVPHPDFGEAVTAAVKLSPGGAALSAEAIGERLADELANYKLPKRIYFVDELPRTAMGKVQKNVLRERYREAFVPEPKP
ncbi:MAG: malonyl-CoA synthase [Alphaproteobacteria bacterium]